MGHGVLIPTNVKRGYWAHALKIEKQCKDPNKLFCDKTCTHGHALNPAHRGAVVAKKGNPLLYKVHADMLHHDPKEHKASKLQVRVGKSPCWI